MAQKRSPKANASAHGDPQQRATRLASTRQRKDVSTAKYEHTKPLETEAMVDWMETESNRAIILGESTTGKRMAHGSGKTKISGFRLMAAHVRSYVETEMKRVGVFDSASLPNWDGKTCRSRWTSLFNRFRNTRDRLKQSGFGISEEQIAQGVDLEAALEKSCPCFRRIEKMFGEKANVEPKSHLYEPDLSDDDASVLRTNHTGQHGGGRLSGKESNRVGRGRCTEPGNIEVSGRRAQLDTSGSDHERSDSDHERSDSDHERSDSAGERSNSAGESSDSESDSSGSDRKSRASSDSRRPSGAGAGGYRGMYSDDDSDALSDSASDSEKHSAFPASPVAGHHLKKNGA